jgi:hypothetical protein
MTSHSNLSAASAEFGKIAVEQSNESAAAVAIFLAITASEAYCAELEQRQAIAAAVADSIATAQLVTVTVTNVENAIRFLRSRFMDVDWDSYPDRITIFGDDSSIPVSSDGDGDEGHWVLNLVIPQTAFIDTNAI